MAKEEGVPIGEFIRITIASYAVNKRMDEEGYLREAPPGMYDTFVEEELWNDFIDP